MHEYKIRHLKDVCVDKGKGKVLVTEHFLFEVYKVRGDKTPHIF